MSRIITAACGPSTAVRMSACVHLIDNYKAGLPVGHLNLYPALASTVRQNTEHAVLVGGAVRELHSAIIVPINSTVYTYISKPRHGRSLVTQSDSCHELAAVDGQLVHCTETSFNRDPLVRDEVLWKVVILQGKANTDVSRESLSKKQSATQLRSSVVRS